MKNKLDAMLDIETLGITERALVVEMGLLIFDRSNGKIEREHLFKINLLDYQYYTEKFCMDISTILFWLNQSKEAQDKVFSNNSRGCRVRDVFSDINILLKDTNNMWCHPSFDYKIFENHLRVFNINNNMPFYKVRDLRTVVELANYDYKNHPFEGTRHTSLDDCKYQLSYLMACLKLIKGKNK